MSSDPKPTTNEQIALLRGWRRAPTGMPEGWIDPNGVELGWVENLPDFEHDWKYAGPLLEELVQVGRLGISQFDQNEGFAVQQSASPGGDRCLYVDTLPEAIAHAWLARKKEGA